LLFTDTVPGKYHCQPEQGLCETKTRAGNMGEAGVGARPFYIFFFISSTVKITSPLANVKKSEGDAQSMMD
jgi:hypothetical protein